jgi:hypothetical protein
MCVLQGIERQLATEQGSKLDTYELEVAAERGDVLRDLAEFLLASVSAASKEGRVCVLKGGGGQGAATSEWGVALKGTL